MKISREVEEILTDMALLAEKLHHEYVTPEHLLFVLTYNDGFSQSFRQCGGNIGKLRNNLEDYMQENLPLQNGKKAELSSGLNEVLVEAEGQALASERYVVETTHLIYGIMKADNSHAAYYILSQNIDPAFLLSLMSERKTDVE